MAWAVCLAAALLSAIPAASGAEADDASPRVYFDLPPQALARALSDFSRITGHAVLVDSAMTLGLRTPAVQGSFQAQDALRRLLAGTGLSARYSGRDAFTLVPEPMATGPWPAPPVEEYPPGAPALAGVPPAAAADFAGALQAAIAAAMCEVQPDTFGLYRAAFQLWIDADGRVRQARLLQPSGSSARDAELLAQLRRLDVGQARPEGLAQPLTVLLSPRSGASAGCRMPGGGEG